MESRKPNKIEYYQRFKLHAIRLDEEAGMKQVAEILVLSSHMGISG